jgi:hypothetical protein
MINARSVGHHLNFRGILFVFKGKEGGVAEPELGERKGDFEHGANLMDHRNGPVSGVNDLYTKEGLVQFTLVVRVAGVQAASVVGTANHSATLHRYSDMIHV